MYLRNKPIVRVGRVELPTPTPVYDYSYCVLYHQIDSRYRARTVRRGEPFETFGTRLDDPNPTSRSTGVAPRAVGPTHVERNPLDGIDNTKFAALGTSAQSRCVSALYLASFGFRSRSFVEFDLNDTREVSKSEQSGEISQGRWRVPVIMSARISAFRNASERDRANPLGRGVTIGSKKAPYNYQQCKLSEFPDR
ncbi:hypothetical protein EAG_15407 [Camponotus floridanus]|uniref:Uncharacterized protein n=1 Tax=Camponotus floridanus TaxID=104421 RepID=E2AW53_CAMFO|nr:hypothetical protein EAG_15407 [Camponotus floridanus]